MKKSKIILSILAGAIVVGGLITAAFCTEKVRGGYIGIQYSMNGGVQEEVLGQGWHIKSPFVKVYEYSVANEQGSLESSEDKNESFKIPTSDGKSITVSVEYSYRYDQEKASAIYNEFRGRNQDDIEGSFIKPKIKAWIQEVSANYSVLDIYGEKRGELNSESLAHLKGNFEKYGIILDSVNYTDIQVDEQTATAIQNIIDSKQALEKTKVDQEKAIVEAETKLKQAETDAQTKIKLAEAEAEANRIINESLTDRLNQKNAIEKWNGEMPKVTGSDGNIIDIGNIIDDANN